MTTPEAQAAPELTHLAPSQIVRNTGNPRKTFNKTRDHELDESVRAVGILQPITVRRVAGRLQLVFGERRLSSAERVGLATIPAMVREMSDLEVLEAQAIENEQREDVHPLEQADAYRRLHEEHGKTVKEIASRLGKSEAHVYKRLKLCTLGTAARAFFLSGKMSAAVADLIARIPDEKLQAKAAKEVCEERYQGAGPMDAATAARHIERAYMLRLEGAPFDTAAEALLADVGACTGCPKRTGNQRELFADVKSPDVCTDPTCYQRKAGAAWKHTAAEAKEQGIEVLSDAEAKKLYPYPGTPDALVHGAGYVDLRDRYSLDPKGRTLAALLGKAPAGHVLARDPAGNVHKLIPADGLKKALKDAGHDFWKKGAASPKVDQKVKAERDRAAAERETLDAIADQVTREIVAKVGKHEPSAGQWLVLLERLIVDAYLDPDQAMQRRGIVVGNKEKHDEVLLAAAKKMSAAELRALFLEIAVIDPGCVSRGNVSSMEGLARAFGVDVKAARKKVIEQRAAAAKQAKQEAAEAEQDKPKGARAKKSAAKKR